MTALCPDNAAWWVDFADSYYVLENYEKAKELFVKALSVDPWNREAPVPLGHRVQLTRCPPTSPTTKAMMVTWSAVIVVR